MRSRTIFIALVSALCMHFSAEAQWMDYDVSVPFSIQENRFFRIYNPQQGTPPDFPLPALFLFHPPHSNAFIFPNETELAGFADQAGAVIVALQGVDCNGEGFVWADTTDTLNLDIHDSYLDSVLATINQAHPNLIDWQRCYATGMATGGSMALHFALFTDNDVAAAAVVGPKRFVNSSPVINQPAVLLAHDIDNFEIPILNSKSITVSLAAVLDVDSTRMRVPMQNDNSVWVIQDYAELGHDQSRLRFIVMFSDSPGMWPIEATHGFEFNHEMWQFFGESFIPAFVRSTETPQTVNNDNLILLSAPRPNPGNSQIIVPIELKIAEPLQFVLYNLNGRKVLETKSGLFPTGIRMVTIDVSHLASGTYFLQVLTSNRAVAETRITVVK